MTVANILIAEDNEIMRSILKGVLSQSAAWTVCGEAVNGRQAVAMASELKPDLILLDFLMPALNGIQAAEEILKLRPEVPIVLFTLHGSTQLELEAKRIGVRKVISKSEGLNALVAGLEELLGKTRTLFEPSDANIGRAAEPTLPHDTAGPESPPESKQKPPEN